LAISWKNRIRYIFSKVFGGYLAIVILLSALILYITYDTLKTDHLESLHNYLRQVNYTIGVSITPSLESGNRHELDSLVRETGRRINTRITIIAPDGKVLADSRRDAETLENHLERPEIIGASKDGAGSSIRFSHSMNEEMLYDALAIQKDGRTICYSRTSFFIKDVDSLVEALIVKIIDITIIVVLVSVFLIVIFSRSITRPLKVLAGAARKVAEGNFNVRVSLKNKDEFRELAESFNYMIDHIKRLFEQISMQKEELDLVINSVQEGFLVLDMEGRVIMYNQGFSNIINNEKADGRYYKELLENKEFTKLVKKTIKKKKSDSDEVAIGDSSYLCSSNYLEAKKEIVIVLYNITELKKLEQIKKDFVTNVSHELRTPLTAIKGFVETMEDDIAQEMADGINPVDEKAVRYLNIIHRHTDRLINIVRDLLMLSNLEDTKAALELSEINIRDLVYNVLRIFEQKLNDKNLHMECSINDDIPLFTADAFKLEQLLINLIDNAIKYTDEGGVSISIRRADKNIVIEIRDTGIGIPRKQADRVFERFYTVDKSRSRQLGGTGLGLSIVKHIVLLHNGDIRLDSDTGKGTAFTIRIPMTPTVL